MIIFAGLFCCVRRGNKKRGDRRTAFVLSQKRRNALFAKFPSRDFPRLDIPDNLTHVVASWAALDTRAIGVSSSPPAYSDADYPKRFSSFLSSPKAVVSTRVRPQERHILGESSGPAPTRLSRNILFLHIDPIRCSRATCFKDRGLICYGSLYPRLSP